MAVRFRKERFTSAQYYSTFKALYFEHWPAYLKLKKHVPGRTLRSSNEVQLEVPLVNGTFQDSAAAAFNNLPIILETVVNFIHLNVK